MNKRTGTLLKGFAIAAWLVLVLPAVAEAHALGAEAKLKNGRVSVEAFYDDNTPADAARIIVTDTVEKVIAEGMTDQDGKWSFEAPPPGKYKIAVNAGDGHRASVNLTIPRAEPPGSSEINPDTGLAGSMQAPNGNEMIISEGTTRSEFTGWRRFGLAGLGVILICGCSWLLMWLLRTCKSNHAEKST